MTRQMVRSMLVFTTTADKGAMNAAAKTLNMSVSAVSQQIQKLEQQLGLSLFHRNTRALALTDAGQLLYQQCNKMIALADETELCLSQMKQQPVGELKISAPVGFAADWLSPVLSQLLAQYPQLRIGLQLQDDEVSIVNDGIDLALCIGPLADSSLVAYHLADWPLLLCASPAYISARGGHIPQHPHELEHWDWLCHPHVHGRFHRLYRGDSAFQLQSERMMVNNMAALIRFTLDGLGYAVLPQPAVADALAQHALRPLLPQWQLPMCSVFAVTHGRKSLTPKVHAVIDVLKHCFAPERQALRA